MDFKRILRAPLFWVVAVVAITLIVFGFSDSGGYTRIDTSAAQTLISDKKVEKVTITNNDTGDSATYSNDISGVFGEVSVTATTWTPGRAWSGFVTGGAKFSDAFTDWNGQLGVRRNF